MLQIIFRNVGLIDYLRLVLAHVRVQLFNQHFAANEYLRTKHELFLTEYGLASKSKVGMFDKLPEIIDTVKPSDMVHEDVIQDAWCTMTFRACCGEKPHFIIPDIPPYPASSGGVRWLLYWILVMVDEKQIESERNQSVIMKKYGTVCESTYSEANRTLI